MGFTGLVDDAGGSNNLPFLCRARSVMRTLREWGRGVKGKRKAQWERDGYWFSRTECKAILRICPHFKNQGSVGHRQEEVL